jgi:hypothetical protein
MAGFSGQRKVPRRIDIIGPRDKGMDYIGRAESQLKILENQMDLAEKSGYKQPIGTRTTRYPWGVIEAWKTHDLCGVKITTFDLDGKPSKLKRVCFCGCSLTSGKITSKKDMPCCFTHMAFQTYDVEICKKETMWVILSGIYASDFTYYNTDDMVLVAVMPDSYTQGYQITDGCNFKTSGVIVGHANYLHKWKDV